MFKFAKWTIGAGVAGLAAGIALVAAVLPGGSTVRAGVLSQSSTPASVTLTPVEAFNPVKTQHTLVALVKNSSGAPVTGARVEFFLNRAPSLVGDIVSMSASEPQKIDNTYGVAKTDSNGEARLTITATREGDTDVTAFVPGIANTSVHKVFAVKHWVDVAARFPNDAVNPIGTGHPMTVQVFRSTDGKPLIGVPVKWTITGNPETAYLGDAAPGVKSGVVSTDVNGSATMTLRQITPLRGTNKVRMDVLAAGNPGFVMFSKEITKTWQASALALTKTGPAQVGIGQNATYTIGANNAGDNAATSVNLTDTIPEGMSYVSSTPSGTVSGKLVTWNIGTMDPKTTRSYSIVLQANTIGTWINRTQLTSTGNPNVDATATTLVVQPTLTITKTGPGQANLGQDFSYDMVVRNPGDGAATGVVVTDTLPSGLSFVSALPTATVSGQVLTWNLGTMNAGASSTLKITVKGRTAGLQENVVVVNSAEKSTATARASTLILAPSVFITKTGPSAIPSGFTRTYKLSVTNTGATPLNDVTVADELPAGLSYQSSTPAGGVVAGKRVTWNVGSLAIREVKDVMVVLRGEGAGTWTNVATVGTREGVTARATLDVTVIIAFSGATMSLVDALDPIAVSELETYTIVVNNQAITQDLHNMTIVAVIPAQMSFVSATGPTAFTVVGQEVRFASSPTVRSNENLTFVITVRANTAGSVLFTAIMRYDEFPPGPIQVQEATTIFGS